MIFGAPLLCDEEEREVLSSLRTGWLGTGPKVAQLEREFRDYKGAPYAVAGKFLHGGTPPKPTGGKHRPRG